MTKKRPPRATQSRPHRRRRQNRAAFVAEVCFEVRTGVSVSDPGGNAGLANVDDPKAAAKPGLAERLSTSLSLAALTAVVLAVGIRPQLHWAAPISSGTGMTSDVRGDQPSAADGPRSLIVPPTVVRTFDVPVIRPKVRRKEAPDASPTPAEPGVVREAAEPVELTTSAKKPARFDASTEPAPATATESAKEAAPEPTTWSEGEIADALRKCVSILPATQAEAQAIAPVRQSQCGLPAPIQLKRIGPSQVEFKPAIIVSCPVASALHTWVATVLQPAALAALGSPVVALTGTAGYVCRNRNGSATGPISEHAFGNAVDITAFVLADGRSIDVLAGWGATARDQIDKPEPAGKTPPLTKSTAAPPPATNLRGIGLGSLPRTGETKVKLPMETAQSQFLKRVHHGACGIFGTVLGPEANEAHRNHLHFDLKARKRPGFCQ